MLKRLLFASFFAFLSTAIFAQNPFFKETFNSVTVLPVGWSQTSAATDGGWRVGAPINLGSQYFPVAENSGKALVTNDDDCDCDKSNDLLSLPGVNLTAHDNSYLVFDLYYWDAASSGVQESLELLVSTDNGANWSTLKTFDGNGAWRAEVISLSAYNSNANLLLAFKYNDGGGWLYGAGIDNLRFLFEDAVVRSSVRTVASGRYIDAVPTVLSGYPKFWAGQNFTITGNISNDAFAPITSFTANWTKGTQTVSQSYNNLNLAIGESYEFALDVPIALGSNAGLYDVYISNINGAADDDLSDNNTSFTLIVEGVEPAPGRKVVIEEGTGTWCQWCPRGAVMMDFIADNYPSTAVPIAVHNADPMKVTTYDTGMGGLIGGYPSGLVDRADGEWDPLQFEIALIERLSTPAPVSVQHNVAYDAATRLITVESQLHFLQALNGDYRIAMVITEDDVTGVTSTYRQQNAYSGGGQGPMGGFESLPALVPAAQMTYDHVARTIFNSFTGAPGSVPATNAAGSTVTFTSTYTHPAAQDVTQMHAITMLIDNASGEIINAEETAVPFTITATNEPAKVLVNVDVYPNPVSDVATVALNLKEQADVQLRLADVTGKIVYEANLGKLTGEYKMPIRLQHLNAGTYMLTVNTGAEVTTKPVMVVR